MADFEWRSGDIQIIKVPELDLNGFTATQLLPGFNPAVLSAHPEWADPRIYDATTGHVFMSIHTWVVRIGDTVILIDAGAGNGKNRPTMKVLDHLHQPYLERLAAVGVRPEDVDYVLLTHIHADHVGWNTRWNGERWVPTFPHATVICSDREWRYGMALSMKDVTEVAAVQSEAGLGEPTRVPVAGVFQDSMAPLEATGCLRRILVDGREVLEGVRFLPTPGHSIDHAAIAIHTPVGEVIFGGDVVHHPFEWNDLDLVSMFCEFPAAARRSRRWLAEYIATADVLYCSSHFPVTSAGRLRRLGRSFQWNFIEKL